MVGKWIVMMQENVARIFKILQCPIPSWSAAKSPSVNRNSQFEPAERWNNFKSLCSDYFTHFFLHVAGIFKQK